MSDQHPCSRRKGHGFRRRNFPIIHERQASVDRNLGDPNLDLPSKPTNLDNMSSDESQGWGIDGAVDHHASLAVNFHKESRRSADQYGWRCTYEPYGPPPQPEPTLQSYSHRCAHFEHLKPVWRVTHDRGDNISEKTPSGWQRSMFY